MISGWVLIVALGMTAGWVIVTISGLIERWAYQRRRQVLDRLCALVSDREVQTESADALDEARKLLQSLRRTTVARLLAESSLPYPLEVLCCARLLQGSGERRFSAIAGRHRTPRQCRRRIEALRVLAIGQSALALDLVESALDGSDDELTRSVPGILGRVPDRRAALLLIAQLKNPGKHAARVAACLDSFRQDIDDLLIPLTGQGDPTVRSWAAVLLHRYAQNPEIPKALAQLTVDPDPRVRRSALGTLADVGGPVALQSAQQRLADPVADIRARAARALGAKKALGSAWRIALLLGDREWTVRTAARDALLALGPDVAVILRRSLASDDQFVREGAAAVIARLSSGPVSTAPVAPEWNLETFSAETILPESEVLA